MDFDITLILLGLPVAFVLGWVASRMDMRQLRMENRQAPKAYFKGLNFLLNEQQDQAIDAFIEAVQNDPDTSELHFALGNLFRRRGEYERAVRVHQHLLDRGDLSLDDRHRAQHALALDYLKAGLLDRAEDALLKLEGSVIATTTGSALELINFRHPFYDRLSPVYLADYVELGSGTGIVHCSPAYGVDDFVICKKYGLVNDDIINPVQSNGVYVPSLEFFGGQFIFKADQPIIEKLREVGALMHK